MYGKVLGAMIGGSVGLLAQSGPLAIVFAIVGIVAGHAFDRLHSAPAEIDPSSPAPVSAEEIEADAQDRFARHLCVLFVEVAQADGELTREEVRVVREFFQNELKFGPRELESVRVALHEARSGSGQREEALRASREDLPAADRLLLLDALYELALVDGPLESAEREAIRAIATGLEIPEADHRAILALHLGDGHAHYERLGLQPDASDDEIRGAYKRLASLHHPDRVAHLGPGAMELASRRFQEIRSAYDELRRLRNL